MDWENHLEKNPIQKIEKNSKTESEIAACEQKITSEKANFCSNTVFSLYFEIRAKKRIHSVETVREVSQKSNVKIVTYVKRKTWSKGKAN